MARKQKSSDKEIELDSYESDNAELESDDEASLSLRSSLRDKITSDVEEFLALGGKIEYVDANVVSDPPRKPESNYGGQPI